MIERVWHFFVVTKGRKPSSRSHLILKNTARPPVRSLFVRAVKIRVRVSLNLVALH